jgi:Ser/Thr protein kinase RdoA (MazF antagonist)
MSRVAYVTSELFTTLRTPPPEIPGARASELLAERYGLGGRLTPLASERDLNFLVDAGGDGRYVMKFANAAERPDVTDLQNRALEHLARKDRDFPVPRVVTARDGALTFDETSRSGDVHCVRLLTWLDGVPLDEADGATNVAGHAGASLARLDMLLEDFTHAAEDYGLPWDIRHAASLAELLPSVADRDLRNLCAMRIDRFRDVVEPRLGALRRQAIYNDMNPSNVLVDRDDVDRVVGIIDFGDMVFSQRINDAAVAAAYLCRIDGDPFAVVIDFLAAYSAASPLTADEIELLPDLILARHLTTVMITHWRSAMYPDNRAYILRSEKRARRMLETIAEHPVADTAARFRVACGHG